MSAGDVAVNGPSAGPADHWRPAASLEVLTRRAEMLAHVRRFFAARNVMEVETPLLSCEAGLDPHIRSIEARATLPGAGAAQRLFLQASPEAFMKRLLAAGCGPIFQICKAFRDGEAGRWHNPEFTLLEWYRPGFDCNDLMNEVQALFQDLLHIPPARRMTYREAFRRHAGLDPFTVSLSRLREQCAAAGLAPERAARLDRDACLDLLLAQRVQPALAAAPTFLVDFPASQAALAQIRNSAVPVAERFELFIDGIELANGYLELRDAEEQARRIDARAGSGPSASDAHSHTRFLDALRHGLPQCAGVAVGFDRLVTLAVKAASLEEVLAFPVNRV